MTIVSLLMLLEVAAGGVKWVESIGDRGTAKREAQEIQKKYKAAKHIFDDKVNASDRVMNSLGDLRLEAWKQEMNKYTRLASLFVVHNNHKRFEDYGGSFRVLHPCELDFMKNVSMSLSDMAVNGSFSVACGALASWGLYGLVSQLGVTATTGTAINTLAGAAAHNATMAWIGGGALEIGGGGMAAGAANLTGLGLASGFAAGGFISSYQAKKKLEEVRNAAARCDAEINSMQILGQRVDSLKNLAGEYISFHRSLTEDFDSLLNSMEEIYRRNLVGKYSQEQIDALKIKIKGSRLSEKERLIVQLASFAAQVYYVLIAMPLSGDYYETNTVAISTLAKMKVAGQTIRTAIADLRVMSEQQLHDKYFGRDAEANRFVFEIPRFFDERVARERRSKVRSTITGFIFAILIIGVIGAVAYFTAGKLRKRAEIKREEARIEQERYDGIINSDEIDYVRGLNEEYNTGLYTALILEQGNDSSDSDDITRDYIKVRIGDEGASKDFGVISNCLDFEEKQQLFLALGEVFTRESATDALKWSEAYEIMWRSARDYESKFGLVPNLVGLSHMEADMLTEQRGFQLVIVDKVYSDFIPEGQIVEQSMEPNTRVLRDQTIYVTESMGPEPFVYIPLDTEVLFRLQRLSLGGILTPAIIINVIWNVESEGPDRGLITYYSDWQDGYEVTHIGYEASYYDIPGYLSCQLYEREESGVLEQQIFYDWFPVEFTEAPELYYPMVSDGFEKISEGSDFSGRYVVLSNDEGAVMMKFDAQTIRDVQFSAYLD